MYFGFRGAIVEVESLCAAAFALPGIQLVGGEPAYARVIQGLRVIHVQRGSDDTSICVATLFRSGYNAGTLWGNYSRVPCRAP